MRLCLACLAAHASGAETLASEATAAARVAHDFIKSASQGLPPALRTRNGTALLYQRATEHRSVVYAAVGLSSVCKAAVSAASARLAAPGVGTLLVSGDAGLEAASAWGDVWDHLVSLDGHGVDLSSLPEFEAFTEKRDGDAQRSSRGTAGKGSKLCERERVNGKPAAWANVRQLRSLKMCALLVAIKVFDGAIFLDADITVCAPLAGTFGAVSSAVWFAFVPAPSVHHGPILKRLYGIDEHNSPPEPNTGVVVLRRCEGSRRTLERWYQVYWKESLSLSPIQNPMDQPPFRAALHLEKAPWVALPPNMNCRGHSPRPSGKPITRAVKARAVFRGEGTTGQTRHRHVHGINAHFPMRCGGFGQRHWESLARNTVLGTISAFRASPESMRRALALRGGLGCTVLHSHMLPRVVAPGVQRVPNLIVPSDRFAPPPWPSAPKHGAVVPKDGAAAPLAASLFPATAGPDSTLDGAFEIARAIDATVLDDAAVAVVEFGARRPAAPATGDFDGEFVTTGDFALERCGPAARRGGRAACAVVVVRDDTVRSLVADYVASFQTGDAANTADATTEDATDADAAKDASSAAGPTAAGLVRCAQTRAARGETFLDVLLPVAMPVAVDFSKGGAGPRRARARGQGVATAAELYQFVETVADEFACVLLVARLAASLQLSEALFARRPDVYSRVEALLNQRSPHEAESRAFAAGLDSATLADVRKALHLELGVYDALRRLFEAQAAATKTPPPP
ncbi:hypothetical protein M885DRAFT_543615 [Pelagophyceae sp. CCMP2097]|nr:hypothetical protein M885DRAFT_543615 [Pelagophyceae sp. CCMP2097]